MGEQSTKMTITRDLKKLIDDGVIEKLGNAKATFKQLFVEQYKQAVKTFNLFIYFCKLKEISQRHIE